jgi:hypothetical protein
MIIGMRVARIAAAKGSPRPSSCVSRSVIFQASGLSIFSPQVLCADDAQV